MAITKAEVAASAKQSIIKPNGLAYFQTAFSAYEVHVEQAAPKKGIGAKRSLAIAAQYYASHPELHGCDLPSMIGAVLVAGAMELNVMLREVYFIPYSGKIQLQISYFGWIKLAMKSGMVKDINARAVYEGDAFDPDFELKKPNHKMGPNYGDPSKVTHSYCVIELMSGGKTFEVLTRNMIERLRAKSPMQKNGMKGPWATDYDKMSIAKVIKQAVRMVPTTDEWRSFTFADESITSIEGAKDAVENYQYSYPQEGSAEVVPNDTPPTELTEDQKNQADFDAQQRKEAAAQQKLDLEGGK